MARKRRTIEQKIADANQALFRARNGQSMKNDIAVMSAFTDRGIPAETIDPVSYTHLTLPTIYSV